MSFRKLFLLVTCVICSNVYSQNTQNDQKKNLCDDSNYKDYIFNIRATRLLLNRNNGLGCELPGMDFSKEDLTRAYFNFANLQDANFVGAILTNASLEGADLSGADLSGATIINTNLSDVITDENTKGVP
ncbi:MAG: pentapeptide repeat-containing protein [Halobacteriovoraceae bacterium]|nr:pentapeptide repeat-containing protein [Halobacteriovoraceae bacterium]